ncbi:MAG: PAS domain S-box protein, partial [Rhodospirillaceae bacterium]|nr:PAS domain S-box protein [Rhodospirillaceae bacterium]
MKARHELLERQLREAGFRDDTAAWHALLDRVDAAYRDFDSALRRCTDEMAALRRDAAAEAEARFRVILDRLVEGVAITDMAGVIRLANHALADIAGAEPGELGGRPIWALFPALTPSEITTAVDARRGGRALR